MDAEEFWYLDPVESTKEKPKPWVGTSIIRAIARIVRWRDRGQEKEPVKKRA